MAIEMLGFPMQHGDFPVLCKRLQKDAGCLHVLRAFLRLGDANPMPGSSFFPPFPEIHTLNLGTDIF